MLSTAARVWGLGIGGDGTACGTYPTPKASDKVNSADDITTFVIKVISITALRLQTRKLSRNPALDKSIELLDRLPEGSDRLSQLD